MCPTVYKSQGIKKADEWVQSNTSYSNLNLVIWILDYSETLILETFRFKDENDYEYEIWLQVFSRILKI